MYRAPSCSTVKGVAVLWKELISCGSADLYCESQGFLNTLEQIITMLDVAFQWNSKQHYKIKRSCLKDKSSTGFVNLTLILAFKAIIWGPTLPKLDPINTTHNLESDSRGGYLVLTFSVHLMHLTRLKIYKVLNGFFFHLIFTSHKVGFCL